jgi:hypothetical protein
VLLSVKNQLSLEETIIAENHLRNLLTQNYQEEFKNSQIKIKEELIETSVQDDFDLYSKNFDDFNNLDFGNNNFFN